MKLKRNAFCRLLAAEVWAALMGVLPLRTFAQSLQDDEELETNGIGYVPAYRTSLLKQINKERAKKELDPLELGDDVHNAVAERRAKELAERYSYLRPDGRRDFTALADQGLRDVSIGEDYVAGCSTSEAAMDQWMSVDFTQERILNKDAMLASIGHYEGGPYNHYWVVIFSYPEHYHDQDFQQEVLDLVNSYRAENGLSALKMGGEALNTAAQLRAEEISRRASHTRPDGRVCFTALEECGATDTAVGENAAWGLVSPREVVDAWIDSEDHRANILAPDATKMSVGYYYDASSEYGHQWIQIFAK